MPTTPQPHQTFIVTRLIHAALMFGVLAFAGVAWYLTGLGTAPFSPDSPAARPFTYAWAALAIAASIAAFGIWRSAVERFARPDTLLLLQSRMIVAWALTESIGLTGIVAYLLFGEATILWSSLLLAACGFALFRPRAEWFLGDRTRR